MVKDLEAQIIDGDLNEVYTPLTLAHSIVDEKHFHSVMTQMTSPVTFQRGVAEYLSGNIYQKLPLLFEEFPRTTLSIESKSFGPAAYYFTGTADGKRP